FEDQTNLVVMGYGGRTDVGDQLRLSVKLTNVGNVDAPSFIGTLTAPTGDATIQQNTATWQALARNHSALASSQFRATMRKTRTCGSPIVFALSGNAGGVPFELPLRAPTGTPGTPQTFASTDVPKSIPDASSVSSIRTLGGGIINDVSVTIGSLTHTFDQDLQIELSSPDGTTVRLFSNRGGSGDNLTNTTFSDAARMAIGAGTPPFTGSLIPEQPLSAFKGKSAAGDWKLTVRDTAMQDTGTLNSWSLTRSIAVCD